MLEMTRVLEEATKESLLSFGSWLRVLPQAHEALELLHYLYEVVEWFISIEWVRKK